VKRSGLLGLGLVLCMVFTVEGGEKPRTMVIDGLQYEVGPPVVGAAPLTEVFDLQFRTGKLTGGDPCILISGKFLSRMQDSGYVATITIELYHAIHGHDCIQRRGNATMVLNNPEPGKSIKFHGVAKSCEWGVDPKSPDLPRYHVRVLVTHK